jgi:serine phosphatase RsbU (regulator of sigma subunit)/anti-sigma regulatory factor (Ser/Thr protein kinase)
LFKQIIKEELKVPAHTDYLADLRDFVVRVGKKYTFPDKIVNTFKLAVDEASTNIMRHAYRESGEEGFITIRALIRKQSLTICLIDQGKFFDPRRVQDPDLQRYVQIGKKGGLGIFMMRKLMDEIDYRRTEEGNELRMTKNLEAVAGKKSFFGVPVIKSAVKAIPFSLKAKYWVRTCLVLIGIVVVGYLYFYFETSKIEFDKMLTTLHSVDAEVNRNLEYNPGLLNDVLGNDICKLLQDAYKDRSELLYEIALVDPLGNIVGHHNQELFFNKFSPAVSEKQKIDQKTSLYEVEHSNADKQTARFEVYDVTTKLQTPGDPPEERTLHIRAYKAYTDERIAAVRWEYARLAASLILLSCAGAFGLVYILMTPLHRLAEWVRRADHGEIGDEMDIDSSTEIGEIAQAFSEITSKFRASQKNLADQERLQKEMQVAQEIQQTLLPREFPELDGYELASHYEAAREVGGDYYDFVEVDKDTLGVMVADVSGKGVPGSLVMTMIRQALRTEARGVKDAAEVLARVNKTVIDDMKKGMFVTLFYVIIDSKRRRLNYASAGHNPMILYRPASQKTYYLNPRGFPVGIRLPDDELFRKSVESDTIQLAEDDILFIYTDGITEAMNARRELFGEERLLKIIRENGVMRVKPFVEKIKDEIFSFTAGETQSDDITLVAIKEKTSPEKVELQRAKQAHRLITLGKSIREACEVVGITTYAYYNKYKKEFEEKGVESVEVDAEIEVEAKHIAIEDKVKIFDIIKNHPEYGAKRISEELNTEVYSFTLIPENKIYDELVRNRLNTRQLREGFVARGGRTKRPMKPPGTPLLTLSGEVILDRSRIFDSPARPSRPRTPAPSPLPSAKKETGEKPAAPAVRGAPEERFPFTRKEAVPEAETDSFFSRVDELLASEETPPAEASTEQTPPRTGVKGRNRFADEPSSSSRPAASTDTVGISFEDLFAGGTILEEFQPPHASAAPETPAAEPSPPESASIEELREHEEHASAESGVQQKSDEIFSAVDDLLRSEIDFSFSGEPGQPEAEASALEHVHDADAEGKEPGENSVHEGNQRERTGEVGLPFVGLEELVSYAGSDDLAVPIGEDHEVDAAAAAGESFTAPASEEPAPAPAEESHDFHGNGKEESAPAPFRARTSALISLPAEQAGTAEPGEDEREQLLIAGLRYYRTQQFDEAIHEFERAIVLFPNFKEAHSILGNAYFRNRMYDEAARAYQRVKQLDATDTTAYENMGVIYANRGEYMEAMKEWQRVLEIDPSRDDIRRKIELAGRMMMKRATTN